MTQQLSEGKVRAGPGILAQTFARLFAPEEDTATELLLIRHAQPDYAAQSSNGGAWDPPLTSTGHQQALRLAGRLRRMPVQAVYSSTMRRAAETAGAIASAHGLPVSCWDALREIEFDRGALAAAADNGRTAAELALRFLQQPSWDALPGFEPAKQFRHRTIQAIEAIVSQHPGERVALVVHGGVINAYLSMVLGIAHDMFFLPAHASVSMLLVHGDLYAVASLNDVSHVPPALVSH
jgi:probable phosphoglycerate mutase